MKKLFKPLVFGLSLACSPLVWAHSEEALMAMTAPHGGMLAMSGAYHLELLLKPKVVQLYVTDHAMKPSNIKGTSGEATLMIGGKAQKIPLTLSGDHLEGPATIPANAAVTTVVKVRIGGKDEGARYSTAEATQAAASPK